MKREIDIELCRVTEATAIAAYKFLGKGDKNLADGAAVEVMRAMLNKINFDAEIVIGEGEIDEAPMLYIGEKLGNGDEQVDIAVDPIEGTRMVAMGQANALVTILAAEKGSLLKAPDMYMEKLIVNERASGVIDIDKPIEENISNIAKALNKKINELTMITLSKPRHDEIIKKVQEMGVSVFAIPDGDIAASILVHDQNSDVDFMYTVGGAPEGVVSAGITRGLDGDMQAKLILRSDAKGKTDENLEIDKIELARCKSMNVDVNKKYELKDLVSSDNVAFSATGITRGDLLEGVVKKGDTAITETLLIRGKSGTLRIIKSSHNLKKKDSEIYQLLK